MATIGANVGFNAYYFEDSQFTVLLNSAITKDDLGKALSMDGTNKNQLKLAADGDTIVARLETFEDRLQEGIKIGTASFRFSAKLPIGDDATVAVGDTVVGAGSGTVKRLESSGSSAPDHNVNVVMEVVGDYAVVLKV